MNPNRVFNSLLFWIGDWLFKSDLFDKPVWLFTRCFIYIMPNHSHLYMPSQCHFFGKISKNLSGDWLFKPDRFLTRGFIYICRANLIFSKNYKKNLGLLVLSNDSLRNVHEIIYPNVESNLTGFQNLSGLSCRFYFMHIP
jgi:hypothetical protein